MTTDIDRDKQRVRERVWAALETAGAAPAGVRGRIPRSAAPTWRQNASLAYRCGEEAVDPSDEAGDEFGRGTGR